MEYTSVRFIRKTLKNVVVGRSGFINSLSTNLGDKVAVRTLFAEDEQFET